MFLQNLIEQVIYHTCANPVLWFVIFAWFIFGVGALSIDPKENVFSFSRVLNCIGEAILVTVFIAVIIVMLICVIVNNENYLPGDHLETWQYVGVGSAIFVFVSLEILYVSASYIKPLRMWKRISKRVWLAVLVLGFFGCTLLPLIWSFFKHVNL